MQDRESHSKPIEELVSGLQTHLERGLTQQEAEERLGKFGLNELTERPRPGFFSLLWDQFNNYLVIILIIAAVVSLALGEYVDSIAIMFIVVLDKEIPLGDRKNTAFMGTLITYGRGRGLVTGTGMNTQIGLIAEMIQSFEAEDTPLQKKLEHLGKVLGTACLAICALVFVYGLFRDTHLTEALESGFLNYLEAEKKDNINPFMTAVSLAIAAVPEGLPAIVTICLALGMQRMIKHHALIRKLPAVETLGCATVVCSDKTGTLTQNEMTVVQAWAGGKRFRVTGEGYSPSGE